MRQRAAPARHRQDPLRLRLRGATGESGEAGVRRASDVRLQVMTKPFGRHGCLTLAFSGATSGNEGRMRIALRGLRCNALLDGFLNPSLIFVGFFGHQTSCVS